VSVIVFINGQRTDTDNAHVSVFDRGFLYGDSVFETIRTYAGRPFALGEHLSRLKASADKVFIPLPLSEPALGAEVEAAVAASGNPESYIRVIVTRGSGPLGLELGFEVEPLRVLLVTPLHPPPDWYYSTGIAAVTFQSQRPGDDVGATGAKLGNYLVAVLAGKEAKARGAQESLIVNRDGGITEGATSNLFWVESGGLLLTPDVCAGILPGVTRARVLEVAGASGLEVAYATPDADRLRGAEEVFITSSIRELVPVVRVDEHPIGTGRPGPVARGLLGRFRTLVGEARADGVREPAT
jgi:branched-chain amino acid aminotransferase